MLVVGFAPKACDLRGLVFSAQGIHVLGTPYFTLYGGTVQTTRLPLDSFSPNTLFKFTGHYALRI